MDKINLPKVAHLTEAWQGGIATYVEGLIKHQLESGEFAVHLICAEGKTPGLTQPAFNQYFYKSSRRPWKFLHVIKQIKRIIDDINPDIIHAHSSFAGVYSRLLTLKKKDGTKIPIVYCAHGWSFCQDIPWYKKSAYKFIEQKLLKNTNAIINLSSHEYHTAANSGITTKIQGIILSCVREVNQSSNAPLPFLKDKINIGFIGRLDKQKGYDFFAQQMQLCKRDDIKVHVIGSSVLNKEQIPVNNEFNYIGWVDNSQIDDYIKQLDVVVIPSRWEGFSLLVLEVMRNSKPVIVSNRTSLPEAVIQGFNGYIFDFNNPNTFQDILAKLDKNELTRMGKNARMVFEQNFCGERHCMETTGIYRKVLKAG